MRRIRLGWPSTMLPSALAALTAWVALWAWAGFVQSSSGYLMPTLWTAVLVAVTGMLLRSARLPALLVALAQLVVLAVWLTHRWAGEEAYAGWLPTPDSVAMLGSTIRDSVVAAQSYAAPVGDTSPSIFPLLVLTGTAVIVLVDLLACGLRRVPVSGLPLLAVYTAPASILDQGVPWWAFVAAAVCFLALLVSDESSRLAHWGRHVTRSGRVFESGGKAVSTGSVRTSARRIGATATGLAVVAPWLIPTFGGGLFDGSGGTGEGPGAGVSITNPMVTLRRDLVRGDDVDLVRVSSTSSPSYLRISVLDEFTGEAWRPSPRDIPSEQRADGSLPPPPGLSDAVARGEVDLAISTEDEFDATWLPAPYPVTSIEVDGDWRFDLDTLDFTTAVDGQTAAGLDYRLSALEVRPTIEDLRGAGSTPESIFAPFTALPEDMPDIVGDLADRVTDGLGSRFEKAVELQRWFREDGGFTYSLERDPGTGSDDLTDFLTEGPGGRVGYCEQFAASMALMGRTLGIPSRVAVGFLRPDRVSADTYVFSAHDLHAWPEMYFDDVGWVRFEPTPADRALSVPRYTFGDVSAPAPTGLPSASTPTTDPDQLDARRRELDPGGGGPTGDGDGGGRGGAALVTALVTALLVLAPRAARAGVRRRRWALATPGSEAAEAGWAELRDTALDLRVPWDDSVTLRTRAAALATSFGEPEPAVRGAGRVPTRHRGEAANPQATRALSRLVDDVERARFARAAGKARTRDRVEVERDVATCREALRLGASRGARRISTWAPASLLVNLAAWSGARAARAQVAEPSVDRAV